jgi:atypical dual specificity phosphatase
MSPHRSFARDNAVAVRIGDRDLLIGNRAGAQSSHSESLTHPPDYVVSVNRSPTDATTDHHPLSDGVINDQTAFEQAVEAARQRHRQDGRLLVNCAAGISRSSTVLATLLAIAEDISFATGVQVVQEHRPVADPHLRLRVNARSYLAGGHGREADREALAFLAEEQHIDPANHPGVFEPVADLEESTPRDPSLESN